MKKLNILRLMSTVAIAAAGVFGIASAKDSKKVESVNAAGSLVGGQSLFLKVNNSNWTSQGAAFALHCFNSSSDNSWAWFDSPTSLSYGYSVATVPEGTWANLIVVRMNPSGWDSSNNYLNWNNKWNQTSDITTIGGDVIRITGSGWDGASYEWDTFSSICDYKISHSNETDGTWSTTSDISLSYTNSTEGARFYTTSASLETGMKFDIVRSTDNAWFHSDYLEDGGAVSEYISKHGTSDAVVEHGGVFEFYIKIKNNSVWTQVSSATEAEKWSKGFVEGVGCTNTYNSAPANWATYVGTYGGLTDGAKNVMYGATGSNASTASYTEKAVFIYDMCVRKYASCAANPFMTNSSGTPRSALSNLRLGILSINNSSSAVVIVIILSVVSATAVGGYFFIRKRKENN